MVQTCRIRALSQPPLQLNLRKHPIMSIDLINLRLLNRIDRPTGGEMLGDRHGAIEPRRMPAEPDRAVVIGPSCMNDERPITRLEQ